MKYLLIAALLFIGYSASAQSLLRTEPKLLEPEGNQYAKSVNPKTDSILNVCRFGVAVSPTGLTFAGVYQASAGLELGIQHQDYNYATQVYSVLWSANLVWIPINTAAPIRSIKDLESFGALYGPNLYKLLGIKTNNVFQIGPFYNPNAVGTFKDKAGLWVVAAINLNN